MENDFTYDPEDLEKLMREKPFSQLLPEEKAFVLQFVDSDLEYDSMREMYETLGTLTGLEPAISPKAETKSALMDAFHSKQAIHQPKESEETHKLGFWTWFWDTNKSIFSRPAFQLASVALIISSGYYLTSFSPTERTAQLTENKKEQKREQISPKEEITTELKEEKIGKKIEKDQIEKEVFKEKESSATLEEKIELKDASNSESLIDLRTNNELELVDEEIDLELKETEADVTSAVNVEVFSNLSSKEISSVQTDVIYDDNVTNSTLEYDSRTVIGNSQQPSFQGEIATTSSSSQEIIISEKKSADKISSDMALNASNFSSLLGKLYTAE